MLFAEVVEGEKSKKKKSLLKLGKKKSSLTPPGTPILLLALFVISNYQAKKNLTFFPQQKKHTITALFKL